MARMTHDEWQALTRSVTIRTLAIGMHDMMMYPGDEAQVQAAKLLDQRQQNALHESHIVGSALIVLAEMGLLKYRRNLEGIMTIKTVAELIEMLQMMPQDDEPIMLAEDCSHDIYSVESNSSGQTFIGERNEIPSELDDMHSRNPGEILLEGHVTDDWQALKEQYPLLYKQEQEAGSTLFSRTTKTGKTYVTFIRKEQK